MRVLEILRRGFTLMLVLSLLSFYAVAAAIIALGCVVTDFLRRRR